MNNKFSTTSSSLFSNENESLIPEWMKDINTDVKQVKGLDLNFDVKGIFAEKQIVYRDQLDRRNREVKNKFNENSLITASKLELAKFLTGKHYNLNCKVNGNIATLEVSIEGIPTTFNFSFEDDNGKLKKSKTFTAKLNDINEEYPFSKAGFEECCEDIKNNYKKSNRSIKVASKDKYYTITLEEVTRRYNNHLRLAMDKINELLAEGSIVGVGSNVYASFYDTNFLFPQMEKENKLEKELPKFEFVDNIEHVATNQIKSDKNLTIESSSLLAQFFDDFKIIDSFRDKNELFIKAKILTNGLDKTVSICFGIDNEKVSSLKLIEDEYDNRMTLDQFLNSTNIKTSVVDNYLSNNKHAKRIYRGIVLTEKNIKNKLFKIVSAETVNKIIENWEQRKLITPVNSTTFISDYSFENLLKNVNAKLLTNNEIDKINELSNKSLIHNFDKVDLKDTGIRDYDDINNSEMIILNQLNNKISYHFKNYKVSNLNIDKNEFTSNLTFINPNTGLKNKVILNGNCYGNKIENIHAIIKNNKYELNKLASLFSKNEVLSVYTNNNRINELNGPIQITASQVKNRLSEFYDKNSIELTIQEWIDKGLVTKIDNTTLASNYTLEQLIDQSNLKVISEKDRKEILLAKQYFGQSLSREAIKDTGIRMAEEYVSEDTLLRSANEYLSNIFKEFENKGFSIKDNCLNYNILIFDNTTGLSTNLNLTMTHDKNKILECKANINNELINIENVKMAFSTTSTLKNYLKSNSGNKFNAPMIISISNLKSKLKNISNSSDNEINDCIDNWIYTKKVNKLASNILASKFTLEHLISISNLKALNEDEFLSKIKMAQKNKYYKITSNHIKDNDTRSLNKELSAEQLNLYIKSELNKQFDHYELLSFDNIDDEYVLEVRAINKLNGIRQKFTGKFNVIDNKPSKLILSCKNVNSEALNKYLESNKVLSRSYKGIISKNSLKQSLSSVIDINKFNQIEQFLLEKQIISSLDSNNYFSDYSMPEIIANLSKFNKTDLKAANKHLQNSNRQNINVNTEHKTLMVVDSRKLEAKKKELSPAMITLKEKILNLSNEAYNNKLITSKKLTSLESMLNTALDEKDLENAFKELKKYL